MHRNVIAALAGAVLIGAPAIARAQDATEVPGEATAVEGTGYPVGEGTVLHPTLGAEVGFTDNVFYSDATRDASGILRLVAEGNIASKEIKADEGAPDPELEPNEEQPAEPAAQSVTFRAGGRLAYQEYLSPTVVVRDQRDLAADLGGNVIVAPQGTFSFAADERFVRDTRPTNFEGEGGLDREANALILGLKYQPGGHQLTGGVQWENQIDYFEKSSQQFANRMINTVHARSEWTFFPYSKAFADLSYGFISGFGSGGGMAASKHSANPIRGGVGIQTAITEDFTVKAAIGWEYAAYSDGVGFNAPRLGTELGYRYSPIGRLVFNYDWLHEDSINADYLSDQALRLRVDHQFGKLVGNVHGDVRFRTYEGVDPMIGSGATRNDLIFAVGAGLQWLVKDWLAAVADYRTEIDQTDYRTRIGGTDNPSFVRTEVTAGIRAAL